MSCPLSHVLVLLNLSRRPARLLGEAARRVVVLPSLTRSACSPRVFLSSARPLLSRLSTRRAGRLAICVGSVCDCGFRADVVRVSCGWLLAHRFACVPPVFIAPLHRHGRRGGERLSSVACFFRIFPAMCGFCGSRSLRLPGVLPHGILSLCRRGRMNAIAVHRNSLACFSIPIAAPLFASSPVFDAYSGHGHFQSFHARLLMGPLLSTRLGPFACLIAVDGPRRFYAYHFCGELVKTAPTDAIISNRQSINVPVSSRPSPRLSCRRAGRLLLTRLRLVSGHFCIIPVCSGIEHFSRNNTV